MNESQQTANNGQAAPQAPPTTQQESRVKTYAERFQEMEQQMQTMVNHYMRADQAFTVTSRIVQEMSSQIRLLNDQIQAMYDLHEAGTTITRQVVADKVNKNRAQRLEDVLKKDEAAGLIKKVDSVTSEDDIVAYTSEETAYAFQAVSVFKNNKFPHDLMGAKKGDVLGDLTVQEVYQITAPAKNSETQPQ